MRRRLLRFVAAMVLVPLGARLAVRVADGLERRRGPSLLSRSIRTGAAAAGRRRRRA